MDFAVELGDKTANDCKLVAAEISAIGHAFGCTAFPFRPVRSESKLFVPNCSKLIMIDFVQLRIGKQKKFAAFRL